MGVEPLNKKFKYLRPKVLILFSDDWEGLYIDGKLIEEGHSLGEGDTLFILKMAEEFGFTSADVTMENVIDEDEIELSNVGSFPQNVSELKGKY